MAQLMSIKRNLEVCPGDVSVPAIFHVSQGDKGTRIILGLVNNSANYTIPEGTTAIIRGSRSDGTLFEEITADVETTEVKFNLTEDITSVPGPVECEAVLSSGTANVIGTANFIIDVERSPASIGSVIPGTDAATLWLIDKLENESISALDDESVVDAINDSTGSGLTEDVKVALLACFEKVAWIDEDGQDYYDALYDALYPSADLVSISAVFTQGENVIYDTDGLDTLRQYLVVTAHFSDSTTQTVIGYTLSGTLTEGLSVITVSYSGKTTTFNVTVSISLDSIAYGSLTYRDIFVTNNVVPLGDFNEELNLSTSFQYYHGDTTKRYKINAGSPSQSTEECISPTKSLKCFGSSSAQIQYLDSASMSGTYLAFLSVNVSRYSAGKAGINVYFTQGVVAIDLTKNVVTDGWEYMVGTGTVSGSNPALSIYIGSMSSANLDSYIDDVIVTPLPSGLSEADALILYKKYLQIMGATV